MKIILSYIFIYNYIKYKHKVLLRYNCIMSSNLDLNKFLEGSDYVDNTAKLRDAKHSKLIRECINDIEKVRKETGDLYKRNIEKFKGKCNEKNNFLFMNYFTIFNKT